MKKLPYWARCRERLRYRTNKDVFLITGLDAWPHVKFHLECPAGWADEARKPFMWLPAAEDPSAFDFRLLSGLYPVVQVWGEYEYIHELVALLSGAGVEGVIVSYLGTELATVEDYDVTLERMHTFQMEVPAIHNTTVIKNG